MWTHWKFQVLSGDNVYGDNVSFDSVAGTAGAGAECSESWLRRLTSALGFGSGPGNKDVYLRDGFKLLVQQDH